MCAAAKGYSLHIGLNYVDPARYAGWDGALNACENDADDMASLAADAGFRVQKLIRAEATRDAVISSIRTAAAGLEGGDIFLLSYSGHGSQAPNAPGGDVEEDGNDETWCLFDGQLIDDELELLWHGFEPGVRILFISDSCHSATMARAMPPAGVFAVPPAGFMLEGAPKPRLMPPAIARRIYMAQRDFYAPLQVAAKAELVRQSPLGCTVRTLAGCLDRELSYDGDENGQFTAALLAAWDFGRFRGDYARFHREITRRVQTPQTPQHNVIGSADPAFEAQVPFTILQDRGSASAFTARGARRMNNSQRATNAIERYILDRRPGEIGVWRSRAPGTDWGMDGGAWRDVGVWIIDTFNALDPSGGQIDSSSSEVETAIDNAHQKTLGEFHQYLALKADQDEGSRALRGLESARTQAGQSS